MKRSDDSEDRKASSGNIEDSVSMPKKRFFRSRAHCNPLSHNDGFEYPVNPEQYVDSWRKVHYPGLPQTALHSVDFLDIGMGFGNKKLFHVMFFSELCDTFAISIFIISGGLTVALAQHFPDMLVLGMEIRAKVSVK